MKEKILNINKAMISAKLAGDDEQFEVYKQLLNYYVAEAIKNKERI